jgi:hypothetical protein
MMPSAAWEYCTTSVRNGLFPFVRGIVNNIGQTRQHRYLRIHTNILQELFWGITLALPVCTVLSQSEKRFVVRRKRPTYLLHRIFWWYVILVLVGELMLEPLSLLFMTTYPTVKSQEYTWMNQVLIALSVAIIRSICMSVGLYLGQSFFPIALTGSIATGMSRPLFGEGWRIVVVATFQIFLI